MPGKPVNPLTWTDMNENYRSNFILQMSRHDSIFALDRHGSVKWTYCPTFDRNQVGSGGFHDRVEWCPRFSARRLVNSRELVDRLPTLGTEVVPSLAPWPC